MQRKNEIHDKPRFDLATKRAHALLLELDICEFPVDPRKIIRHFPEWHLHSYTELKNNADMDDPFGFDKTNAKIDAYNNNLPQGEKRRERMEGVTKVIRGDDTYIIVYDDRVNNEYRVRWTLAHEIGHIALGHLLEFEMTALNRSGLSKKAYGILEVEANWFAAELLAPRPALRILGLEEGDESALALLCSISKEAADRRLAQLLKENYYDNVQDNQKDKLLRNFWQYLESNSALITIHESATSFSGSYLYPEMAKHCRVCKHCNACIGDDKQQYCHVCGGKLPDCYMYTPYKNFTNGGAFMIGYDIYVKGKPYQYIDEGKDNRVAFCPVCKNHDFSEQAQHCKICGTALYNRCIAEDKVVSASCHYCPDCGSEALFNSVYANLPRELNPVDYAVDLDDYIEYEYWNFVCMTIGYWEKDFDLYTALDVSKAYRDDEEIVILVSNEKEKAIVDAKADIIRRCISNNAYTYGVRNVRCYSRGV